MSVELRRHIIQEVLKKVAEELEKAGFYTAASYVRGLPLTHFSHLLQERRPPPPLKERHYKLLKWLYEKGYTEEKPLITPKKNVKQFWNWIEKETGLYSQTFRATYQDLRLHGLVGQGRGVYYITRKGIEFLKEKGEV